MAGGMRPKAGGPTLAERSAGRSTTPCPVRHVWVSDPADHSGTRRPGLLTEWRSTGSGGWEGLVAYGAQLRPGQWSLVQEWVPAALLSPA